MSSMQNLITWLRSKAKKARHKSSSSSSGYDPESCDVEIDFNEYPQSRSSICRSSMKLPPIPRGDAVRQSVVQNSRRMSVPMMGVASLQVRSDSPAHIYEEIIITDNEEDDDGDSIDRPGCEVNPVLKSWTNSPQRVNVKRLDFDQARDFGSFLAVPIKRRLHKAKLSNSLTEENNNQEESDPSPSLISPCDNKQTLRTCTAGDQALDNLSSTYPGDNGSSGDSAIGDMSSMSHDHSLESYHGASYPQGRRRQGIFNGVAISNNSKIDMENLEIQTYFNKQMLQDSGETVERFLIVPSRIDIPDENETEMNQHVNDEDNKDRCKDNTHGSDDSNDTCNEYDMRSSDQSSSSQSRPGSYAFDSGSSLYAFGDRTQDANGILSTAKAKQQESDSSNDTFSEYDSKPTVEYEYYLSKAQHNLWLKRDVMRVIRESESSEYETTDSQSYHCDCLSIRTSDNSSLTTITSLSDISLSDKDEKSAERETKGGKQRSERKELKMCTCKGHRKSSKQRTKSKSKHRNAQRQSTNPKLQDNDHQNKNEGQEKSIPAWEIEEGGKSAFSEYRKHPSRKPKSGSRKKAAELYCLPDFAANLAQPVHLDVDSMDKLSCRATDFKPLPLSQVSKNSSTRKLVGDTNTNLQTRAATRMATPRQSNILSDLMKMNHDRLLVQF